MASARGRHRPGRPSGVGKSKWRGKPQCAYPNPAQPARQGDGGRARKVLDG